MTKRVLSFEMSEESASAHSQLDKIRIGFKSQDGHKDYFRVTESASVHELVQAFCKKRKVEYKSTRFVFDQKKLAYRGTVAEAGLKDQDEIDVLIDGTSG